MLWCKEKYHVYITRNTYRGMLLEAGRHPGKESIIQMPGIRIGNDFYFDVVADSGINATYMPTMCEKDHMYADHLATRISEYYDFSNGQLTVSQVHRHPDGCLRFSQGDYPANIKLARQFGGVVNGLIFIDPSSESNSGTLMRTESRRKQSMKLMIEQYGQRCRVSI